ncbi:hypothetical protein [Lutibacter citreus]|uniref:hypothetical protein n=1 Tax=Lutibacter citreus TaxID=2138210 RepID=UPI000DBE223E|nr:hypothetical protein [Lutibacter citreus]
MKNKYFLITLFCITLSLVSCSNDDSTEPQSKNEMLTDKSWMVQSKIVTPSISLGGMEISDITMLDEEEVKSYIYKFSSDGTLVVKNSSEQIILETSWGFNSDKTQLTLSDPLIFNYPVVGEIGLSTITLNSLTTTKMVGTIPSIYDGVNYVVTITFV